MKSRQTDDYDYISERKTVLDSKHEVLIQTKPCVYESRDNGESLHAEIFTQDEHSPLCAIETSTAPTGPERWLFWEMRQRRSDGKCSELVTFKLKYQFSATGVLSERNSKINMFEFQKTMALSIKGKLAGNFKTMLAATLHYIMKIECRLCIVCQILSLLHILIGLKACV